MRSIGGIPLLFCSVYFLTFLLAYLHAVENPCTNLNAISEIVNQNHYLQYLVDSQPITDYYNAYVTITEDVDFKTMLPSKVNSTLIKGLLQSDSKTFYIVKNVSQILYELDPEAPSQNITLIGLSNTKDISVLKKVASNYFYDPRVESVKLNVNNRVLRSNEALEDNEMNMQSDYIITTKLVKQDFKVINHTAYVSVVPFVVNNLLHFSLLDTNSTTLPMTSYNHTFGIFRYRYPSKFIQNEPIYDVNGEIIGQQDILHDEAEQIQLPTIQDSSKLQKIVSVRILNVERVSMGDIDETSNTAFVVDFIVTLLNQGSLKVVRYRVTTTSEHDIVSPFTVEEVFAKVVMPSVSSTKTLPLGGKLALSRTGALYLSINVAYEQKKAFENYFNNKFVLDISEGSVVPFVFKISADTGDVIDVLNFGSNLKSTTNYANDIDVRGNSIALVGTTIDYVEESTSADLKNLQSFYSVLTNGALFSGYFDQSVFLDRDSVVLSPKTKDDLRFIAQAIAFSIDKDTMKFNVGGGVIDYEKPWYFNGRLSLVQVQNVTTNVVYNMQVGYDGSNQVKVLRRATAVSGKKGNEPEVLNAGLSMHGPTSEPPKEPTDDKFRSVASGFWQVDCEPLNVKLSDALHILFYTMIGITGVIFITIVGIYGSYGIYLCIKGRKSREYERLVY
ncbi:hypothetical protein ABK040_015341 [Willaertia magna]